MTLREDIELLQLYNERATELLESSFVRQARDGPSTTFTLYAGPFRAVREGGPEREAMKAFLLTFRLFVQKRDGLSFREIHTLYGALPISGALRDEIADVRQTLNRYLDRRSTFVIRGERITCRQLLDVWMNGELAHVNRHNRAILRHWGVGDDIRTIFQFEFELIVLRLSRAVAEIRDVNTLAIAQLRALMTNSDPLTDAQGS